MSTEPEMRRIIIEAPSGERFEADVPCDAKVSQLAVDFFEDRDWPTEQHGQRQRAVVEWVNPLDPNETKRLNGDGDLCDEKIENGDTLRIFSESIAGATPLARQRALIDDHNGMITLCERDTHITFKPNRDFAPDEYLITFTYPSFVGEPFASEPPQLGNQHQVLITLRANYPRQSPFVKWKTPIFHPNIRAGDGFVCLGVLGERYLPGMGLSRLVRMLAEMVQWRNFDAANGLNRQASVWAADSANWPQIEAIGGHPFISRQEISAILKIIESVGRPRITFRSLSATRPEGAS